MKALVGTKFGSHEIINAKVAEKPAFGGKEAADVFADLQRSVHLALETYSNVHRGSGHNSLVTTHLYEQAREIVLEYLGLDKDHYVVIFCTPRGAEILKTKLHPKQYRCISSQEVGLPLGVRALAVERGALASGVPFQTGGGTVRLVSPGWVIWAKAPDRLEAGTPAIINIIAFAKALRLIQNFGETAFHTAACVEKRTSGDILYHDALEASAGGELLAELRQTLIGRGVRIPTRSGPKGYINLDNGASTPTFQPIWDTVYQAWRQPRRVQQEIIREVRAICARALNAPPDTYDIIFTSNTTESINLAAGSLSKEYERGVQPVVLNTLLEHNSNELPWRWIPGGALIRIPVDVEGFIDLKQLDAVLCAYNHKRLHGKKRIKLVAVSGASNVLGTSNDLAEISRIAHHYGAQLLVDAAQLVAHRTIDVEGCAIDYLAFSAHKVYAPFGTGVLLAKKGLLQFTPAEMETIQTSGEENVGGIAALGKALVLLQRIGLDVVQQEEQALTAKALRGLARIPGLKIYGIQDPDSPRFAQKGPVIPFNLPGTISYRIARELAERGGIGVRAGCHCAHLLIKHLLHIPPLVQQLQGLILLLFPRVSLPGVVRVSLGIETSETDIDTLIDVVGDIAAHPPAGTENPFAAGSTGINSLPEMKEFIRARARIVYTQ